jgi:excisionase family DNA binding protein
MNDVSIDQWIAKGEVMQRTGLNERTLERKVKAGEIRREYRHIPGRKGLPVYHPDDVEKLLVRTLTPIPMRTPMPAKPKPTPIPAPVFVPIHRKVFLTLKEAAEYSGLPQSYLKRCLQEGKIHGAKIPHWRIKREDLQRHELVP